MHRTIKLSPGADVLVRRVMRVRGLPFEDAVNAAIVGGLVLEASAPFHTPVRHLGRARLPLDKALSIAADFEDEVSLDKRVHWIQPE